jgi:hypothetical protein
MPPAPVDARDPDAAHQPGHPLSADPHVQDQAQLGVDAWGAVGAMAAGMDVADLLDECRIGDGSAEGGRDAQAQ